MIYIKRFNESFSSLELYHYTSIDNLRKILNSGKLVIKPRSQLNKYSRNDVDASDYGYISLTEDDGFHLMSTDINTDVRIVFDKTTLENDFELVPFSYDEEKYKSIKNDDYDDLDMANDDWYGDESELRVLKNIPIRYIKCIEPIEEDIPKDVEKSLKQLNIDIRD